MIRPKEYYERYWSSRGDRPDGSVYPELLHLLEAIVSPETRVLDVGCGDGRTCGLWLKRHAREYVGVDISELAVMKARFLGLNARVIEDATTLPFPESRFDVIICVEVLEHVFLPDRVVAEIRRVLRPGGALFVTVPNVAYWRRRLELVAGRWNPFGDGFSTTHPWRDPHIRFFTKQSLHNLFITSGFKRVNVGGYRGSLLRDIPYVARLFQTPRRSTKLYQLLQQRAPALLGLHLYGTALKRE